MPGDSRIRRSGHPRSFHDLRKLALKIAAEKVVAADGSVIPRAEQLLRSWVKSRVPALQLAFAAYAWGKPPEKIEAEGLQPKTTLTLYYAHERPDSEPSAFRLKQPSATDDGNSRRLKGP